MSTTIASATHFADETLSGTLILYDETKKNVAQLYKKMTTGKTKQSMRKITAVIYILMHVIENQQKFCHNFHQSRSYIIKKVPTNDKYILCKLKTKTTQVLHRTPLQKYNREKLLTRLKESLSTLSICIHLPCKQISEVQLSIIPSYTLILTLLISMKVILKNETLLLSVHTSDKKQHIVQS